MSDERLRHLERRAAYDGPDGLARLEAERRRRGLCPTCGGPRPCAWHARHAREKIEGEIVCGAVARGARIAGALTHRPVAPGTVGLYMRGVLVAKDDGEGRLFPVEDGGPVCEGTINYVTGTWELALRGPTAPMYTVLDWPVAANYEYDVSGDA